MKDKFLYLTLNEGPQIIVGIANIALIERDEDDKYTVVTLNFARNKDLWPKTLYVKETLEEIKVMIDG